MGSKTLNISIPEEQFDFLQENPSLSASKLFQAKVSEIQNSIKHNPQLIAALQDLERLKKKNEKLGKMLQQATDFIQARKLWEDFLAEVKEWI